MESFHHSVCKNISVLLQSTTILFFNVQLVSTTVMYVTPTARVLSV